MITREQIQALQVGAWEAGDYELYGVSVSALGVGPDCFGWYLCEQAIMEGLKGTCTTEDTAMPTPI
jgi:hypothetical protein